MLKKWLKKLTRTNQPPRQRTIKLSGGVRKRVPLVATFSDGTKVYSDVTPVSHTENSVTFDNGVTAYSQGNRRGTRGGTWTYGHLRMITKNDRTAIELDATKGGGITDSDITTD